MAGKDVVIKISATDAASPTFKRIAGEAKAMGASVDSSAKQASASMDKVKASGMAVGAAMGAAVGGVSLAGRAFVSQEQQIRGLNRAYGESSVEIQRFAEELQKSTTYSNDAARQAAQVASTLVRSYGLTADQIQLLIGTTADLAAVNVTSTGAQFDLVDAVSRTAGAIRGEGEAAEALGLTLSDSAVAAAAAARGLTGWTTTMTEAEKAQFRFTLLLEQSQYAHGAAADAADTNAGKAKQWINSLQDQVQGLGDASGAAGEYLSVMGDLALALPLVTGMLGKLAGGLGALGGGTAVAGIATLAAASYYAYSLNQKGSGTESATAGFLGWAAGSLGFEGVADQFNGIVKGNDLSKATNSLFYVPKGTTDNRSPEEAAIMNLKNAGVLPWNFSGNIDEAARYISAQSGPVGLTNAQYIDRKAQSSGSFTLDPVTGQYVFNDTYTTLSRERALTALPSVGTDPRQGYGSMYAISQGYAGRELGYDPRLPGNVSMSTAYMRGGTGAIANSLYTSPFDPTTAGVNQPNVGATTSLAGGNAAAEAKKAADAQAQWTRAIEETYGAYSGLILGINTTESALAAFKATQDGLSAEMDTYQSQASEWTGQLNAQEAAYKILEERQQNGIALTQEQTDFMNNYAHAVEVGTGAVEDATLAAGINAQNLLLNKEAADVFKESTGSLTESINVLIETLGGIPPTVESEIVINQADYALAALQNITDYLNSLDGRGVTFFVNAQGNGLSLGSPGGVGITDVTGMNGLTMNAYAGGGTVYGGNHALVGERGPEVVWLPNGAQVTNTEGSKSRMQQGRRGGGDIVNYGPINLQPASTDVYGALSSQLMGGVR